MIESLRIYRFRGIMECSIENLRRLNVFLGYNNCGKSSVLDALFLFCGASNPKLNLTVNTLRNFRGKEKMQCNSIFIGWIQRNLSFWKGAVEAENENGKSPIRKKMLKWWI